MNSEHANPVGQVIEDEGVGTFIKLKIAQWDVEKVETSWWKFWKKLDYSFLTVFLMSSLDDLISYMDDFVDTKGSDKKATVMDAMGKLYDYIVREGSPLWMKPFATSMRYYILNHLISAAIDWMINKYRHGEWRKPSSAEIKAQWTKELNFLSGLPFGGVLPK